MTKLNSQICLKIREARRSAGLSQSEVAAEVGCKQSALSMFEKGDGTKLNEGVIKKLSEKFGVSLEVVVQEKTVALSEVPQSFALPAEIKVHGFCPNASCPSNRAYEVDGRTRHLPNRLSADPIGGKFCALCGEVLEKRCPNCGAPLHDGAICSLCGEPYIA